MVCLMRLTTKPEVCDSKAFKAAQIVSEIVLQGCDIICLDTNFQKSWSRGYTQCVIVQQIEISSVA